MAIREFGESLLADVRARKDQQSSDQRKEDRKAERSQLKGAALGFIAKEGLGIIKNNMEQKTQDFLANSNLYSNKIKQNNALQTANEQITYINAAKKADLTLPEYFLRENAKQALLYKQVNTPNSVAEGTEEEWKATFMKRQGVIDYSQQQADFATATKVSGQDIVAGRAGMTLEILGSRQRPATLTASLFDRLRGKEITNIETFNTKMELTKQVVAANSILSQQVALAESFAAQGNLFLADMAAPDIKILQENDGKEIDRLVKSKNKVTNLAPRLEKSGDDIVVVTGQSFEDGAGNITYGDTKKRVLHEGTISELDEERKKLIQAQQLEGFTGLLTSSVTLGQTLYNADGQDDLTMFIDKNFGESSAWDIDTYKALTTAVVTGKHKGIPWLVNGERKEKLSTGAVSAMAEGYIKRIDTFLGVQKSRLQESVDPKKTKAFRDAALINYNKLQLQIDEQYVLMNKEIAARGAEKNIVEEIVTPPVTTTDAAAAVGADAFSVANTEILIEQIIKSGVKSDTTITHKGVEYPITTDDTTGEQSISVNSKKVIVDGGKS